MKDVSGDLRRRVVNGAVAGLVFYFVLMLVLFGLGSFGVAGAVIFIVGVLMGIGFYGFVLFHGV